jgi:hypothetical protein
MDKTLIRNDIRVFFVTAKSFPQGIMAAFDELRSIVPGSEVRTYYGISRPEKGIITYKAAVEELYPGEAENLGTETMVIKKGEYVSSTLMQFMKNVEEIGCTFQKLLSEPELDPDGYCIEWYFNETDVKCMVKKKS